MPSSPIRLRIPALLAGLALTTTLLTVATPAPEAQADSLCTSTIFTSSSKHRYRLPTVVTTDSGRVFAFAERRVDNHDGDDRGNFDVVMRTSTDGGCTWQKTQVVADFGNRQVSNPVAVYDRDRDQVLLITTVNHPPEGRYSNRNYLHRQYISADGSRWTSLRDGKLDIAGWRPGLSGPGHAIQLSKGTHAGRIILPMGYTRNEEKDKRATRGIYSDDGGATWRVGYDRVSPGSLQLIEGSIAELPDGRLLISYRDNGKGLTTPGKNRVSGYSVNGGQSVGGYQAMTGIKTVPVQGSLLQTSSLLLFSSPSNTGGKITSRKGMRIFVSTDSGKSWKPGLAIGSKNDSAAYSDLVQLDAGTIGIAYESGYTKEKPYWHKIVFRQVRLSTIANTVKKSFATAKTPTVSGTAKVGKTLKATGKGWKPSPAKVTYQWLRNGKPIAGATKTSYKLKKADRGKKVSVRVKAAKDGFQTTSRVSKAKKIR